MGKLNTKKLVFFENSSQINMILLDESLRGEGNFIALTPQAMYELDKRGMSYNIPEDFYTEEELKERASQNFEKTERALKYIQDHFKDHSSTLSNMPDNLFHDFFFFYLKFYLLDPVFIRLFALSRVLDNIQPEKVVFFNDQKAAFPHNIWGDPWRDDLLYSRCMTLLLNYRNIDKVVLSDNTGTLKRTSRAHPSMKKNVVKRLLGKLFRQNDFLVRFHLFLKLIGYKGILNHLFSFSRNGDVLTIGLMYDKKIILRRLASSKFGIIWWAHPYLTGDKPHKIFPFSSKQSVKDADLDVLVLRREFEEIWEKIKKKKEFMGHWLFDGINLFGVIEEKFDWLFTEGLSQLYTTYKLTERIIDSCKIDFLLTTGFDRPHRGAILSKSNEKGVLSATLQHGGFYGYVEDPSRIYTDLEGCDFFLAWGGTGAVKYLQELGNGLDKPPKIMPVGSAYLANLKNEIKKDNREAIRRRLGIAPDRNVVIYVPTSLSWPERFLPCCAYAPNTYFKRQEEILNLFKEFPMKFIIKLHFKEVDEHPLIGFIRDHDISNCSVLTTPLSEILAIGDLFITDFPSTTLLEMLLTDKKILLFTDLTEIPIYPKALNALKKRVMFSDKHDGFMRMIRDVLEENDFSSIENPDEEFLREYANCNENGEIVTDTIQGILEEAIN